MALNKRMLQPGQRIRVLVVDDSVVIRRLVTHALEEDAAIEVVGAASNGAIALQRIAHLNPDVVTLDIEMPEMDGLAMLRQLPRDRQLRIIMFSTMTERGALCTLEALSLGADDYVTKASNDGSLDRSMARLRDELLPKIKQFFHMPQAVAAARAAGQASAVRPTPAAAAPIAGLRPKVVAIGVSTGGPTALAEILPKFPANFRLPVLIVQHMPPMFTRLLGERLDSTCSLRVREAIHGEPLAAGTILIAPGGYHLTVATSGTNLNACLDQSPLQNSCRPAVDALFASVAESCQGAAIGAVLTGMGQDGMRGAQMLKARGAAVLAQDEATSVVWGMPGAVVNAGLADCVLPLDQVVPEILRRSGAGV